MYLQTIVVIYLFTDSFLDVAIYRSQDYHMITATDQNKQGQHKAWHILLNFVGEGIKNNLHLYNNNSYS